MNTHLDNLYAAEQRDVTAGQYVCLAVTDTGIGMPMSEFDPSALPDPQGKRVVFACRTGNRSVSASLVAQHAGLPYTAHLAGGIKAWKEAGLPTET